MLLSEEAKLFFHIHLLVQIHVVDFGSHLVGTQEKYYRQIKRKKWKGCPGRASWAVTERRHGERGNSGNRTLMLSLCFLVKMMSRWVNKLLTS